MLYNEAVYISDASTTPLEPLNILKNLPEYDSYWELTPDTAAQPSYTDYYQSVVD